VLEDTSEQFNCIVFGKPEWISSIVLESFTSEAGESATWANLLYFKLTFEPVC